MCAQLSPLGEGESLAPSTEELPGTRCNRPLAVPSPSGRGLG